MKNSIIGIFVGIVLFLSLSLFVPKATCADGWKSPSIGIRGACSHHGGVKYSNWWFAVVLISIFGGFYTTEKLNRKGEDKLQSNSEEEKKHVDQETPYGSLKSYEKMLRKNGVSEDQIQKEINKYKNINSNE